MQNSGAMYVLLHTRSIDCQGNHSLRPKGFKKSADFLLFMFIFFEGCGMAMSRQKLLQEAWLGGCEGHKPQQRPNTQKRKSIESSKTKLPFFFNSDKGVAWAGLSGRMEDYESISPNRKRYHVADEKSEICWPWHQQGLGAKKKG